MSWEDQKVKRQGVFLFVGKPLWHNDHFSTLIFPLWPPILILPRDIASKILDQPPRANLMPLPKLWGRSQNNRSKAAFPGAVFLLSTLFGPIITKAVARKATRRIYQGRAKAFLLNLPPFSPFNNRCLENCTCLVLETENSIQTL